jgi:hypothetical protein
MMEQNRFNQEVTFMSEQHKELLQNGDPYYNKNLTLFHEDFSLAPIFASAIQSRDESLRFS